MLKYLKLLVTLINIFYKIPFWCIGIFFEGMYDAFTAGRETYQKFINRW